MKEFLGFFQFFYNLKKKTFLALILMMFFAALLDIGGLSFVIPLFEGAKPQTLIGRNVVSLFERMNMTYSVHMIFVLAIAFFVIRSILFILKDIFLGKVMTDVLTDIRLATTKKIFSSKYAYLIKKDISYINNALVVEFNNISMALKTFVSVVVAIIFAVIYLIIPLVLSPRIVLLTFCCGIPLFLVIKKVNLKAKSYSVASSAAFAALQKMIIQAMNNVKYLKATHAYSSVADHISQLCMKLSRIRFIQELLQSITENCFRPLGLIYVLALFYYQVSIQGQAVVEVAFVLFLLMRSIQRILNVQQSYRKFLSSVGSIFVYKNLTEELEINAEKAVSGGERVNFLSSDDNVLRFRDVSFSYHESQPVLNNISFEIKPRATVGIVGPSGSGKSTIVSLMTGILTPRVGSIMLGKHSYEDLSLTYLRESIGYVTQEGVIFNDSVYNNVTMWNVRDRGETFREVVCKAHVDEFVDRLSEQYDTVLGDNGVRVSGGQRQRICIARELYKETGLLIFDEATSSLDSKAETEILNNIAELKGTKTMVIVTHRLAAVKDCDMIIVVNKGVIEEQGTYEELLSNKKLFYSMVKEQKLDEA